MRSSSPLIQLRESLEDLFLPADKQEIIAHAAEKNVDDSVLEMLMTLLPHKEYETLQDISEHLTDPSKEEDVKSKHSDPIHKKIGGVQNAPLFSDSF